MPLDAVFLSALTRELVPLVEGSRVDKIRMPERDTVLLGLRTAEGARTLLLCAGSGDARIHFTEAAYDNPAQPPMFCMLLRKHLTGAQITSMEQLPGERAVSLRLRCYDPFQGETERTLVLELMGRYANLIFIDGDGLITDCLKRVDLTESEKRQLLPGLRYEMPPPQEDRVPFHTLCMDGGPSLPEDGGGTPADRWLIRNLSGVCPLMCREIAFSAFGQTDVPVTAETAGTLAQAACAASAAAGGEKEGPWMILRPDGAPMDFYCYPVRQYGAAAELRRESSFSGLLEQYYTARSAAERMRQKAAGLTKTVRNARDRTERKIGLQRAELLKTRDREELRRNGDIISANLYRMKRGDRVLSAEDFYDPESRIREIALDPAKSPQQNAAAYYRSLPDGATCCCREGTDVAQQCSGGTWPGREGKGSCGDTPGTDTDRIRPGGQTHRKEEKKGACGRVSAIPFFLRNGDQSWEKQPAERRIDAPALLWKRRVASYAEDPWQPCGHLLRGRGTG